MEFIGKDPSFKAVWSALKQNYTIFKDNKFFMVKYKFSEVKPYLD